MKSKRKGFTVLELILALGITVLVLGVVYSFFLTNTRTINETQINLDLQKSGEDSLSKISKKIMEARSIVGIISDNGTPVVGLTTCNIFSITFQTLQQNGNINYELRNHVLTETVVNQDGTTTRTQVGQDIQSITVNSIDNAVPLVDGHSTCRGINISISLAKNYSGRTYTYTVRTTINFRNHS
ncbi:prepilin-type N-terminal cleavage/methylation domain-containing protein [Clostridium sp. YIM B02505]|uniref:Prepilin-type N-terminal cleavage/methylation domain-containing protein n=1 Tax=Clostridium yunnanense TaxID=2800325 RepID=A0ABS1EMC6_9CLOT|nr:prepilin-type N-terminal cleavage/methylation domain-containing protein [Clostridium yunnanense]MBK1810490.1 prepilin-type N-terminal cleavage/methylation domain-containing protein [Clostridium yunnanense]